MTSLVEFLENLRLAGARPARLASARNDEKEYP